MMTKYGTSLLDFAELNPIDTDISEKAGDRFEKFAAEYLRLEGFDIVRRPAVGPDGGCDMIVEDPNKGRRKKPLRFLVSCKNYSRRISCRDDKFYLGQLDRHKCDSFILFYSNDVTQDMREYIDSIDEDCEASIILFTGAVIEETMLETPKYYRLMRRYFPKCYNALIPKRRKIVCEYSDCNGYEDARFVQFIYESKNFAMKNLITCKYCAIDFRRDLSDEGILFDSFHFKNE
ncbi:restriction endonuclease [Photobacterium ganghwense]|uniref:restriction endonuclease n=1 Tax=Photobacterium ganghwense TaxID=320778 RepID=UPI001A90986E|nr:restriction endonuclease [Photobacterium ganghwense]QSV17504.1 restriction endonuclease [Photobacterium ganghwense]